MPEFYYEQKNSWVTIPKSRKMLKNEGLGIYINSQHSFEAKMFTVIYERLFKFKYEEPDENYFPNWNKINLPFWHGDKNFPVGYYHAGYFEFIDLKSCKIIYSDRNYYTISVNFFSAAQFKKGIIAKNSRIFRHKKDNSIFPQIYDNKNNVWKTLPKLRQIKNGEEGFTEYIEKQQLYSWTMFKIVYKYIFGIEYKDLISEKI